MQGTLPVINEEGEIAAVPVAILDRKMGRVGHKAAVYLWCSGPQALVKMLHGSSIQRLRNGSHIWILQLEDKLYFKGGRVIQAEKWSHACHEIFNEHVTSSLMNGLLRGSHVHITSALMKRLVPREIIGLLFCGPRVC